MAPKKNAGQGKGSRKTKSKKSLPKKAARRAPKKAARKMAKKAGKKPTNNVARSTTRKAAGKAVKKVAKKSTARPVKKVAKKTTRTARAKDPVDKALPKKAVVPKAKKKRSRLALDGVAAPTTISVTFTGGLGSLNASLFQNLTGAQIGSGNVMNTGTISFGNASSNDVIAINGTCTGTVDIVIDVATNPGTPVHMPTGNFNLVFLIL